MSWENLLDVDALARGWVTPASHGTRKLAVYDTPEGVFVTAALCSHAGADLCDGYFSGHAIECPLHQGLFDVKTGDAISAPAVRPIKTFPARIKGGYVQILVEG